MSAARVDALVWLLIYGGMFLFAVGVSVARRDTVVGWALLSTGVVAVVAGIVLIFVRSRMKRRT